MKDKRRATPTNIIGTFVMSMLSMIWFFIVLAFYIIIPCVLLYLLAELGVPFQ